MVVRELSEAQHAYVCLSSHGPAHIHFVVRPVSEASVADFGAHGAALQAAMFDRGNAPADVRDRRAPPLLRARDAGLTPACRRRARSTVLALW